MLTRFALLLCCFVLSIGAWQVTIINQVKSCPSGSYEATISLFLNSGQVILNQGSSYVVQDSNVPQYTGIGIQENGEYCRVGGGVSGCDNPDNAGMQLWMNTQGQTCATFTLDPPFYCGSNPPNAELIVNVATSGSWPNCVATLTRKANATDCDPSGVQCTNAGSGPATAAPTAAPTHAPTPAPTHAPTPAPPAPAGPPTSSVTATAGIQVALYSFSANAYVAVDSSSLLLVANSPSFAGAAHFNLGSITGGLSIQNSASAQFASADNSGNSPLIANRPAAQGWETFVFTPLPNSGFYVIQATVNGQLVSVQSNLQLLANVPTSGAYPGSVLFYIVSA